jgi:maltose alpha-D-glucosyltransferase/alpha-amylase
MIAIRKAHPAFSLGSFKWFETESPAVAAYWRSYQNERILILNNLSPVAQVVHLSQDASKSTRIPELFSGVDVLAETGENGKYIHTKPYEFLWLKL